MIAILFMHIFSVVAQPVGMTNPDEFEKKVQHFYADLETLQANFEQRKHSAMLAQAIVSKGKFYFEKPENVRWEQINPNHTYFIITPEKFIEFDGQREKQKSRNSMQANLFSSFLLKTLDGSILQDDNFERTFMETKTQVKISLTPKDKRMQKRIAKIDMWFDKKSLFSTRLVMYETETEFTEIVFSEQQKNQPLPNNIFPQ